MEENCKLLLEIEKEMAALKMKADLLRATIKTEMELSSIDKVSCSGFGSVSYAEASESSRLDKTAVELHYEALDISLPIIMVQTKAHVKCYLNK